MMEKKGPKTFSMSGEKKKGDCHYLYPWGEGKGRDISWWKSKKTAVAFVGNKKKIALFRVDEKEKQSDRV